MYEQFVIGALLLISVLFVVQGATCNKPADTVVKFCRGNSLTSSNGIFLEADLSPSDQVTECSCTVTIIQSESDLNSSQLRIGSTGNWASCGYRLEASRTSGDSLSLGCNKTISPFSSTDAVNIKLQGHLHNSSVSECVLVELIPATNITQFKVTCQNHQGETSIPASEKPLTNIKPAETETTYNIKKIDVLNMKGDVKYEDKSHIVVPICVGVGTALIIIAIIGVILSHRIKHKNNSEDD